MIQPRGYTEQRLLQPVTPLIAILRIANAFRFGSESLKLIADGVFSEKRFRQAFAGYQPTSHDVFVTTFMRSGTNWALQIAQQIAYRGGAQFAHIHDLVAWPESPYRGIIPLNDRAPEKASPTKIRIIKTHLAADHVPYSEKSAYVAIIRDPKEVLVSFYYFLLGSMGLLDGVSLDDWLDIFLTPSSIGGAWDRHTSSFWDWRHRPNVFVTTFSSLVRNTAASIEQIAAHMGVSITKKQFEEILRRSSFSYMKEHEYQFGPPLFPFVKKRTNMMRRGKIGASGELLSSMQQERVDRYFKDRLRASGSDFPYDTLFER